MGPVADYVGYCWNNYFDYLGSCIGGFSGLEKIKRPKRVESFTSRVKTGCGKLFITVGTLDSKPIEVFATLGKAGGCSNCQNEALCRAISLGLCHGVPVEEYTKSLMGIQCPNPNHYPEEEKALSCPDAIGRALKEGNSEKEVKAE